VAFHKHLLQSYFECFAFVLLKRIQPFWQEANDDEKHFLASNLCKVVGTPLRDYLSTFEKSKSAAQNERNLRSSLPKDLAKMVKDLREREMNPEILDLFVNDILL